MQPCKIAELAAVAFGSAVCLVAQSAPADQPRRHVEIIASARHQYTLHMGGAVDAGNTRDPIVYSAWKQGFDPMLSVKLENTGDTDVVNPWILVNGKRNWRTTKDIAEEALHSYGDPAKMRDAEKARAIWEFVRRNRFHATTGDFEVRDPVKMFNVYGFALCGDNAPVLMDLWRAVGLKTRRGFPIGHCVAEAWYDGGWHMLDADESVIFLDRDNTTVLGEEAVARDHDHSKRAYRSQELPALYSYDGSRSGDYPAHAEHRMDFTLRPGESIEWRWGQGSKSHYAPNPVLFLLKSANLHEWGANAWATLRNGTWTYAPPLRSKAPLVWKIRTPYVIVGGRLKARVTGEARGFSFSHDGSNWNEIARGTGDIEASLDAFFPSPGDAHYEYFVRADSRGADDRLSSSARSPALAGLEGVVIESDLQMAPLAMPSLELGDNRILYTDESSGPRSVSATFAWLERSSANPPEAPAQPVYPADGAEVEGTRLALRWQQAGNAAGYHFELSDEPQMRWALSPLFDAEPLTETSFALPSAGLLNPGQRYYWRVRAKSAQGVWGPWSKTWSFVPQGPGVPLHVRMEQRDPQAFTLAWNANPRGRAPARFRIYGSDERGFSASDEPYTVVVGNQKTRGLFAGKQKETFPANFIAETAELHHKLNPKHAYYRVVAVDGQGNRSGSSAFAEAPRPWLYSEPAKEAKAGQPYVYEAKTIRSIGDLTYRDFGPGQSYQLAFWNPDQPKFSLETEMPRCGNFEPKWLRIDPETGLLQGTPGPADAGEYQVNIRVEIRGSAHVQSFPLKVTR